MVNILRPLTSDEKKEITPLGSKSLLDLFLKNLAKKVSEYQKNLRPYDSYSARIEYEQNVKNKIAELSAAVDKSAVPEFNFGDLDKYGNPDLFEFLEKKENVQTRLVAGIKQEVITGQRYRFRCKLRGNKISILVPNEKIEDFDSWLNETYEEPSKVVEDVEEPIEMPTPVEPKITAKKVVKKITKKKAK